jgi:hypothetical protein
MKAVCKFSFITWIFVGTIVPFGLSQNASLTAKNATVNWLGCFDQPSEKITVHLNRQVFVSGENLFYSVFITNPLIHRLSDTKVLYFELWDANEQTVMKFRNNATKGTCCGTINLSNNLNTGIYSLRIFTNHNTKREAADSRTSRILIINQKDKIQDSIKTPALSSNHPDIAEFFPESGHLLQNTQNKIGFRIFSSSPKATHLIQILSDSGKMVDRFETNAAIGSFVFKPLESRRYHAIVTDKDEKSQNIELPHVLSKGTLLTVDNSKADSISLKIASINDASMHPSLHLYVTNEDSITLDYALPSQNEISLNFPRKQFSAGISHFFLINSNNELVANRQALVNGEASIHASISVDKEIYEKREQVNINCSVQDNFAKPVKSLVSISVSLANPLNKVLRSTSPSACQLNLQPEEFAMVNGDSLTSELIDNILLTRPSLITNWTKQSSQSETQCLKPIEDRGHFISGRLINANDSGFISHATLLLSTADSIPNLICQYSDTTGRFYFLLEPFYDNKELFIRANKEGLKPQQLKIVMDNDFPTSPYCSNNFYPLDSNQKSFLVKCSKIAMINKIYHLNSVRKRTEPGQNAGQPTFCFYGNPDMKVYPSNFTDLPNFKEITLNILQNVKFYKENNEYVLKLIDPEIRNYWPEPTMVLVNGLPCTDMNYISTLGSNNILKIETKQGHLVYGDLDIYGIVSIFLKQNSDLHKPASSNTFFMKNEVADNTLEFETTQYENEQVKRAKIPDLRPDLYWSNILEVNNEGKANFHFFTSDLIGDYIIDIQGVSAKGEIFNIQKNIRVE